MRGRGAARHLAASLVAARQAGRVAEGAAGGAPPAALARAKKSILI